jgi:hypothetical protein
VQDEEEMRMDRIGQNGNDGEHYMELDALIKQQQEAEPFLFRHEDTQEDGRWNWYGVEEEEDATGAEDEVDSIKKPRRGSYEI